MLKANVIRGIKQLNLELEEYLEKFAENPNMEDLKTIERLSESLLNVCSLYDLNDSGMIESAEYFTKDTSYMEKDETFTIDDARNWISNMKTGMFNGDIVKGQHFSLEQTNVIARNSNIRWDNFPPYVFWVTMNMVYSDYSEVAMRHGCDNTDFYRDMSLAFLMDIDSIPATEKLSEYYYHIVVPAMK